MPTRRPSKKHRKTPDPLSLAIGKRVRALRKEKDWSFDAFVEETGLGRGYISELERGLVIPSVRALAQAAKALEVSLADLVAGDSPREQLFELTRHLEAGAIESLLREAARFK